MANTTDTATEPRVLTGGIEIDFDQITDALTGRAGGLRPSKPRTHSGLVQYVWRMAQFHSGADTSMPATASWWLQEFVDEQGIDASVSGIKDEAGEALLDELSALTDDVIVHFGGSTTAAAERWHRAGAF